MGNGRTGTLAEESEVHLCDGLGNQIDEEPTTAWIIPAHDVWM